MRLSEAIRLGAMLHPQGFDDYRDQDGRTCAFGAAQDALGLSDSDFIENSVWPWLSGLRRCPSCGRWSAAGDVVAHLNDSHRWSRERIADWVAGVEDTLSQEVTTPRTVVAVPESAVLVASRP